MDNREFVVMAKRYAVDDVIRECLNELRTPRPPERSPAPRGPIEEGMARWLNDRSVVGRCRSDWFNRLSGDEQRLVGNILEECAERTLENLFCLVDGVGGGYEGVFEIVAVNGKDRAVVNPQNTEMLHDIFSEVREEGRPRS
jgi:hypothetical protein